MRKRALTLIEVMIGLSLMAVVVTVLLNIYRNQQIASSKVRAVKEKILTRQCFQQRLTEIFNHLDRENENILACLTDNGTLFLRYDNGIDHDPDFCLEAVAELYLNKENELCLTTKGKYHKSRKEILMANVGSLGMEFFSPSENSWTPSWDGEREELPSMVKFSIKEKDLPEILCFTFFLPGSDQPILYKKEGKVP